MVGLTACGSDEEPAEENANGAEEDSNTEGTENTEGTGASEFEITEEEKVAEDQVVATVNDVELTGKKYNPLYYQVKMLNHQFGQDIDDAEIVKEQTLTILIEQELIKQDAENKNIEISEEEVEAELNNIVEQEGEEAYQAVLDQIQLTEEELKNQLRDDLLVAKYIDDQLDTEVTDEEVKENYEVLKEENEELGDFEDVEGQIRELLSQQKETEQLQARLDELKEQAEVEELI